MAGDELERKTIDALVGRRFYCWWDCFFPKRNLGIGTSNELFLPPVDGAGSTTRRGRCGSLGSPPHGRDERRV